MMASTNTSSSHSTSSAALAKVLKLQKSFPLELREKYSDRYAKLLQEMTNDAAEFLHKKLHVKKHTEDQVRTVIKAFPAALSRLDDDEGLLLPIQSAACFSLSFPFVPLLAEEGGKLKVGGEGKRGGLLVEDPVYSVNVLQELSAFKANDAVFLDVIKNLRETRRHKP